MCYLALLNLKLFLKELNSQWKREFFEVALARILVPFLIFSIGVVVILCNTVNGVNKVGCNQFIVLQVSHLVHQTSFVVSTTILVEVKLLVRILSLVISNDTKGEEEHKSLFVVLLSRVVFLVFMMVVTRSRMI